jgi:chorismate mutase
MASIGACSRIGQGRSGWFIAAVYAVTLVGCWSSPPVGDPAPPATTRSGQAQAKNTLDKLLVLMRERLLVMHEVAKWKWNAGKPITDIDRERQVLANLEKRGIELGISRQRTRVFMVGQIEAGKLIQEADFSAWTERGQGKFDDARDLNTELRPVLDNSSDQMLAQLADLSPALDGEQDKASIALRADELVRGDGIDDAVRKATIQSLLNWEAD